jgi:hypothetical protein
MRKRVRSVQRTKRAAATPRADDVLDDLRVLRLALQDIRSENERLREARSSITAQLGPLPISAGIIAGVVAAFPGPRSGSAWQHALIIGALVAFALMVLLSMRYSTLKPYRKLRDELEGQRHVEQFQPSAAHAKAAPPDTCSPDRSPPPRQAWTPSPASPQHVVDEVLQRYRPSCRLTPFRMSSSGLREAHWHAAMIEVERAVRGRNDERAPVRALVWPGAIRDLQQACDLEWRGLFLVKTLFVLVVALLIAARVS